MEFLDLVIFLSSEGPGQEESTQESTQEEGPGQKVKERKCEWHLVWKHILLNICS
jgi:hypothetical protein